MSKFKEVMEKFSAFDHSIKPIKLLIGGCAATVALVLGVGDLYERYYGRAAASEMTLTYSPPSPVAVGTRVSLGYRLPDNGYFSLWNIDGDSKLYRVLPQPTQKETAITLNSSNRIGTRTLQPDIAGAKEEMLLLWTHKNAHHPPNIEYVSEAVFRQHLTLLLTDWVEKRATLQIKK